MINRHPCRAKGRGATFTPKSRPARDDEAADVRGGKFEADKEWRNSHPLQKAQTSWGTGGGKWRVGGDDNWDKNKTPTLRKITKGGTPNETKKAPSLALFDSGFQPSVSGTQHGAEKRNGLAREGRGRELILALRITGSYWPSSRITKEPSIGWGRGRGLSGVGAAAALKSAVTVKT
jgi:hypothetical protein